MEGNFNLYNPGNVTNCPVSIKNAMDDILYTIVQKHYATMYPTQPERWAQVQALMWTHYNETFRDLLITWLNLLNILPE